MMREGQVASTLLNLGIPAMIGMIVSALYSVVDAYFVGSLGESQMGAISIVFPIVQFVIGLGMTFGSGAGSYIARLLGKEDIKQASKTASTSLFTAIWIGIIAIVIAMIYLDPLLTALGATSTMLPYAHEYAIIYIPGAILNIFNVCMNNIVIAEGKTKLNLIAMLVGCGLNILLDPIFIYFLHMGVTGAAIATVTAQALTTFMYLAYIILQKGVLCFSMRLFSCNKTILKEVLGVGVSIFMFQLVSSLSMALTNAMAKPFGDPAVAAMGAVVRIMTLGTYVVFGFMKGFQPFTGYNYGAKQYARVKKAINLCLLWSTIFCVLISIVFFFFPTYIVALFTTDSSEMIHIGSRVLKANALVFPFFGFEMVYMSLFLAIGKAKQGGILSICRQGLFFVPLILLLPHLFGIDGLIFSQPLADVFTILLTLILSVRETKQLNIL